MLSIQRIRDNKKEVLDALAKRGYDFTGLIETALDFDEKRRETQQELDKNLAEANTLSKEIGNLYKSGQREKAEGLKSKTAELKEQNKELQQNFNSFEAKLADTLYQIPNIPNELVPAGKNEEDNEIVETQGKAVTSSELLPHWELAEKYNLIDFKNGAKITGSGFPIYMGKGAKLQRSLIQFFLDEGEKAGYLEVQPPLVVNEASGFGTGQLPDKEGQMYHVTEDDLYLIPTAEVPITNIFRDEILMEEELPIKRMGYSACFRREAGSYGKDVKGLNRLHQFDKVEIVQIEHPDKSYQTLDSMVGHVKGLLEKLGLTYRVVRLCGGDLGFTSALTYDMEVFSSAQNKWLEVSSISNFENYQANRLKCRYKNSDGKNVLVHTLNGSALALPRILACLLENNQREDGIDIPEVLRPYTGFDRIS